MFSKGSRYRKLPETVTTDARGRTLKSVPVRPLPVTSGLFLHTVVAGDRLDNLAQSYYQQPAKWWRICDANPEFMSPLALLGQEPLVTVRIPLTCRTSLPLWDKLLAELSAIVGVEDVQVLEEGQFVSERQTQVIDDNEYAGEVIVTRYAWTLLVTFNELNVSTEQLCEGINQVDGCEARQPERVAHIGQQIIIPPDAIG
ncbi:MAG: hypothetical protein R3E79_10855 [Caldilineaceae bacterium]